MIRQPPISLVKYETNPEFCAGPPADHDARRALLDQAKANWEATLAEREKARFQTEVDERRRNLELNREAARQDRREQLKALGETGWGFRNLRAAHERRNGQVLQPTIGRWNRTMGKEDAAQFGDIEGDGHGILYSRKVNLIFGSSESGKSLFAFSIAAQEIRAGKYVVVIDFEDDDDGFVSRLTDLGLDIEEIDPDGAKPGGAYYIQARLGMEEDDFQMIREIVSFHGDDLSLVILDAVTEAMAADGLNPDKAAEVARWAAAMPKRFASLGPGVAIIDHTPLDIGAQDRAQGSQHKKSMIDGVSLRVKKTATFIRGRGGASSVYVAKDRIGSIREQSLSARTGEQEYRGKFAINIGETAEHWGAFSMVGRNPIDLDRAPDAEKDDADIPDVDELMEEVIRVVAENPGIGKNAVKERMDVPVSNAKKFASIDETIRLGLIEARSAPRGKIECHPKARIGQLSWADEERPEKAPKVGHSTSPVIMKNRPTSPHDQERSRSTSPHDQERSGEVDAKKAPDLQE